MQIIIYIHKIGDLFNFKTFSTFRAPYADNLQKKK